MTCESCPSSSRKMEIIRRFMLTKNLGSAAARLSRDPWKQPSRLLCLLQILLKPSLQKCYFLLLENEVLHFLHSTRSIPLHGKPIVFSYESMRYQLNSELHRPPASKSSGCGFVLRLVSSLLSPPTHCLRHEWNTGTVQENV